MVQGLGGFNLECDADVTLQKGFGVSGLGLRALGCRGSG